MYVHIWSRTTITIIYSAHNASVLETWGQVFKKVFVFEKVIDIFCTFKSNAQLY